MARPCETLRGYDTTIGERLISDLDALMELPVAEYEACDHVSTRATSISMVRYPLPGRVMQRMIPRGAAMIALCRWPMPIMMYRCVASAICAFRSIRPPIPTTSAHLYRGIRPALMRCREALSYWYQFSSVSSPAWASFFLNDWPSSSRR